MSQKYANLGDDTFDAESNQVNTEEGKMEESLDMGISSMNSEQLTDIIQNAKRHDNQMEDMGPPQKMEQKDPNAQRLSKIENNPYTQSITMKQDTISEEHLQHLQREDRSVNVYNDWCQTDDSIHQVIKRLTHRGVIKYSFQLWLETTTTFMSITISNMLRMPQDLGSTEIYANFINGSFKITSEQLFQIYQLKILMLLSVFGLIILFCYLIMMILLAIQYFSNKKLSQLQYDLQKQSDNRIQYLSQVLNGIKWIKLNLLEKVFIQKINKTREQELRVYSSYINLKNLCSSIYQNAGVIISSLIFLLADKQTLELGKVFSTLALVGYIFNFSVLYSNYAIEAIYSLKVFDKRITDVIESSFHKQKLNTTLVEATIIDDDYDPAFQSNRIMKKMAKDQQDRKNAKPYIKMEGIYSQWNVQEDRDTGEDIDNEIQIDHNTQSQYDSVIKEVSFEFNNNEKIAVIGRVGSGKTSLFLTILKELCISKGKLTLNSHDVAYAEQNPLIISGTVRANILFGLPYNQKWYKQVINACCLQEDFQRLSKGDMTKLGEMGTQISGGQRGRISLARALYKQDSKVVLIDGSLSALDSRVARHIMDNVIKGLCKDKIVFLITYDLDQASELDYVMLMEDGQMKKLKRSSEFFDQLEEDNNFLQRLKNDIMRQASIDTDDQTVDSDKKEQIIKDENKTAQVNWKTYKQFFSYTQCSYCSMFIIIIILFLINLNNIAVSGYLAYSLSNKLNQATAEDQTKFNITLSILMVSSIFFQFFLQINQRLHDKMVEGALNTKIKFFEVNTNGRILNRFSKDVKVLDIIVSVPWVLIIAIISMIYLTKIRRVNLHIQRDGYRLKSGLMSPINSLIQDTINGLTTIRAFGRWEYFLHQLFDLSDTQTEAFLTSNGVNRWCAYRIDLQGYLIATVFAFFAIFLSNIQSTRDLALIAVGFQLAVETARHLNTAVRWSAALENDMVSIQRLFEYVNLKSEQKMAFNDKDNELQCEQIEFRNVKMRYSAKLQPALQQLSFSIEKGMKIAIIGRTGSGKSSLLQLIQGFRQPFKGQIFIDGQDISSIDLQQLRRAQNNILQTNFVINSGSIQENLDPQIKHPNEKIKQALDKACLGEFNPQSPCNTLSAGQIQLLSLAHAFLNTESKLILLDEPTSQIDGQTQKKVLTSIFNQFKKQTILMIAHRLETAVGFCDKVMVLDQGQLVEFDHPFRLLVKKGEDVEITNTNGTFAKMVLSLNSNQQDKILKRARKRYMK
ncbi:multidrug resistance-associated protein 4 isoform x3 [Stylonychia lemnae]|uniref:Multidrug resistance-associated protein 4 isoform x3 n=1 Tax=Stylonychia lemnae TaxID=5949 RepID=A0A078A600_STYLE|nr:multidrug resistance-associated protein 4 isoform x3 [Stylonychia lemnae]|eukprot:CDW76184.1 multidrug resistance-associated protein 4 isoform x3 [Stylonychia lemnae]